MLVWWCVAIVLAVAASSAEEHLPWWRTAVLYQIYPRSFKDSDGDGTGDLKGIIQKAEYLKEIGVTAVWMSPVYPSPMLDNGYDISDYRAINPMYGTMDDLKVLIKKLKELDIKLLLDIVPNHSSDKHEWFQKSIQRIDPYTDYYVWNNGSLDPITQQPVPPNNWACLFGGSAWEWNDQRKQFYLHQFLKEQPDLNFWNQAVIKEMQDMMKFWLDLGVDGFRVDAVPCLVEDELLRDETHLPGHTGNTSWDLYHNLTQNYPQTYVVLKQLAEYLYDYSQADGKERVFFLEGYAGIEDTFKYYGTENLSLMIPFNFFFLYVPWLKGLLSQNTNPVLFRDIIMTWMNNLPKGGVPNWVLGNHDNPRVATRFHPEIADALSLMTGVLPGVQCVYNGEEIGMQNTFVRWDETQDPWGKSLGPDHYLELTRDMQRTPMQWEDANNAGFSSNPKTWLPVNPNYWWLNVEAQRSAETSHLKVFQSLAKIRQDPVLQRGDLNVIVPNNNTLVIVRSYNGTSFVLIMNVGSSLANYTSQDFFAPQGLDLNMTVALGSVNSGYTQGTNMKAGTLSISLRPKAAVLLKSMLKSSTSRLLSTFFLLFCSLLFVLRHSLSL